MMVFFLFSIGWPIAPTDSTHALGNNWGEYQCYGGSPYLHPGIDVMGITIGKPVYAVQSGVVKAWMTTQADWHWRLAIADYNTNDSVEAWLYAHIDPYQYHKDIGETVNEGELIGYLVAWPVPGFDHLHFARIKDAGAVWQYADWAFIQNPLTIITPYDDTTRPVFENAYGGNKFAFCQNNTSSYQNPGQLTGSVDVIAKIHDDTGLPLPYSVWERLVPYKIEYEIRGQQNLPTTLSFIFHGVLRVSSNVGVIYKDDAVCDSRGDYEYRDYYFIVTNTDGDSVVEASDATSSWQTNDFPDGDYWFIVTAYDAAGNATRDSMLVTVDNVGIGEVNPVVANSVRVAPNPNTGTFLIEAPHDVRIVDVTGRVVATGSGQFQGFRPGMYFVVSESPGFNDVKKMIVIDP